jgi:uncharacterized protein YegP (UPF0339 family)
MRRPRIEIYAGERSVVRGRRLVRERRWRLVGGNGEIQCSGEGHRDSCDARRAVERVRRNIAAAEIVVIKPRRRFPARS